MQSQKCHRPISIIIGLLFCAWTVTYPSGCSSNKDNISPAGISSSGRVTLSWDDVQGATAYNVYFSTVPGVSKQSGEKIQNAANPITIIDLDLDATYYFIVTVVDKFGEGKKSQEISYRATEFEGFIKFENLLAPQDLKIFFSTNSTKLSNEETQKLNRVAHYILEIDNYHVSLNGFSDSLGDTELNKAISKNRAAVVKSYLVGKGLKTERIEINGYGAENFIAGNDTAEGRRMNRRVEIQFR